jgi:hypothetical protein
MIEAAAEEAARINRGIREILRSHHDKTAPRRKVS